MGDHFPVLVLLIPLFTAVVICIGGLWKPQWCHPAAVVSLGASLAVSVAILCQVLRDGVVSYALGGWAPPIGIEYRIDALNGLVLVVIATVALTTAIYSGSRVALETPGKIPQFYTLYLLLVAGLLGVTVTGDAFNLYVLLEVTSLATYGLIAMGSRRAMLACFNYIIMGTIGASLYLLGVGYLYIKTGSLNMVDIQQLLVSQDLYSSKSILIAFILIMLGVWIKMALFPLHGWLPNAYAFAPSSASCLIAPLMTKVTVYVMIRMILTVFGPAYVFLYLQWSEVVVWMAVVAIVAGSIMALAQTDLPKMLSYLIIAEVGYMVGGVWLANEAGMVGAFYHIISDAFMTLCLFLAAGAIIARTGDHRITTIFQGIPRKMPLTFTAFMAGALSMIGVPPTCGFFSKWYLIIAGLEAGQWAYVAALLFSSLINAILFFRIIEIAFFGLRQGHVNSHDKEDESGEHQDGAEGWEEAPLSTLIPLLGTAVAILIIGLFNSNLVSWITEALRLYPITAASG